MKIRKPIADRLFTIAVVTFGVTVWTALVTGIVIGAAAAAPPFVAAAIIHKDA